MTSQLSVMEETGGGQKMKIRVNYPVCVVSVMAPHCVCVVSVMAPHNKLCVLLV